jgi:hypothetical protein
MAIKERKQITGTTEQINAYAGHEGQIVWDKEKKTLVGMSGTAGENYPLASQTYVANEVAKKASLVELTEGLAGKANKSHTHTVSQITDMPKVVLSVNNITPNDSGNVPLGLHAIATSGNYNDLTNKPHIPANTSNWSVSEGGIGWARDNSTGFTIVWGSAGPDTWANFARTFSSVLAVTFGAWDTGDYSWGNGLNNTGFMHNSGGNCRYIAVGFS